jgi:hypothetical protein
METQLYALYILLTMLLYYSSRERVVGMSYAKVILYLLLLTESIFFERKGHLYGVVYKIT